MTLTPLAPRYTIELVETSSMIDHLERFEMFRRQACRLDAQSFKPAEVEVPAMSASASERLQQYLKTASSVFSKEEKETYQNEWKTIRGFITNGPLGTYSIETGTYWSGEVILEVTDQDTFEVKVAYHHLNNSPSQTKHMQDVKEFFKE